MKPTKNRVFCRECGRMKMLFEEEKQALGFLKCNSSDFEGKVPTRAYYCDACCGWHITSRKGESYKNPLTKIVVNRYTSRKNRENKLGGFYSKEVMNCFSRFKSICTWKTTDNLDKRLKTAEEYKERLRPVLSSDDFEVVERVFEEARVKWLQNWGSTDNEQ